MIRSIDQALQLWADELHGPQQAAPRAFGRSAIARLMAGDVVTRGQRGSRVLLDHAAEIELIVNKHLPDELRQVVLEQYCNVDSLQAQKWAACGCSRSQFYRRLGLAHERIQAQMMHRVA